MLAVRTHKTNKWITRARIMHVVHEKKKTNSHLANRPNQPPYSQWSWCDTNRTGKIIIIKAEDTRNASESIAQFIRIQFGAFVNWTRAMNLIQTDEKFLLLLDIPCLARCVYCWLPNGTDEMLWPLAGGTCVCLRFLLASGPTKQRRGVDFCSHRRWNNKMHKERGQSETFNS